MDRRFGKAAPAKATPEWPPSKAWVFAESLRGNDVRSVLTAETDARAKHEQLAWLARISPEHEVQLRGLLRKQTDVTAEREQLAWLARISPRHESHLLRLLSTEEEAKKVQGRLERLVEGWNVQEAEWAPAKHPRLGGPPNAGWFATTGGTGGSGGAGRSPSLLDKIRQRNSEIGKLTGVVTPSMIRANRLANELESAARLPGEVARAASAGLITGEKAVVNGFATAVKDVATLGLSPGQLELIGVTKEDRERGYDTAVAISTGSGQLLIAVGTGGIASALSKGGSVARATSGALIAYDAAGNAVGVVQGVHDATENGVTIANGAQVAAGALGLGANVRAAKNLAMPHGPAPSPAAAPAQAPDSQFRVGNHGDMPTPRPGQHSHHGVMSEWMKKAFHGYDAKRAPAILMPDTNHHATYRVFNKWRAEVARKSGGAFDWSKVSEADIRALSEKMFDAAQVPANVRKEYWTDFEKMKVALRTERASESVEESIWARHQIFSAPRR